MDEQQTKTLHFSFSPVQTFVSQARRTRDLWVGSFLLSWLSGHAMCSLGKNKIQMPEIFSDELIAAIESKQQSTKPSTKPDIGTLPNRFVASLPGDKTGADCVSALQQEWEKIAKKVLAHLNKNEALIDSKEGSIWHRQVTSLWECTWVVGEEGYRLEQRKNHRTHLPPAEPGEKCSVCGERQELSGITDPRKIRTNITEWWQKHLRDKVHELDLRETERLCAVCMIKRAIPIVSEQIFKWQIPKFYPSTAYMAAIDWLIEMLKFAKSDQAAKNAADLFIDKAFNQLKREDQVAERHAKIQGIEEALNKSGVDKKIAGLDGDVFFIESLRGNELDLEDEAKQALIESLTNLHKALLSAGMKNPRPSPFYAMLLMDGDGMGKLLAGRPIDERQKISSALAHFAHAVPEIIKGHDGKLIYAGGDDVFALLPVDRAIECADHCRSAYESAFAEKACFVSPKLATISAAINYAHMNTALGVVVRDSHRLLDDIAKHKTGRNAIACRVWKRGGPILTWSQPWEVAEYGQLIQNIKNSFQNESKEQDRYSSKFLYKLRDVFDLAQDELGESRMEIEQIQKLLVAEYLAIREHVWEKGVTQQEKREKARQRVDPILKLCRETRRELHSAEENGEIRHIENFRSTAFKVDGALLIRFLAQKEV